jgi:hypothetical protein
MDQILRELYREYQGSRDLDSKATLDRHCERAGLLGPSLAEACVAAGRLHDAILLRQRVFENWSRGEYIRLAHQLRNMSWDTPLFELGAPPLYDPMFSATKKSDDIKYMLRVLWDYLDRTFFLAEEIPEIPSFNKYVDILFPLFLYLSKLRYPLKSYDGIEGILLESLTPKEFAEKIGSSFEGQEQRHRLGWLAEVIEEGFVETNSYSADAQEFEDLSELLPKTIQDKLKSLWDDEEYSRFGDFLKDEFGNAFNSARYTGIEVGTFNEMFQTFVKAIDAVTWKSGAVVTLVDSETIEIWISPEELKEAIKTSKDNPFYDLDFLLEEPETDVFIKDEYYDFDDDAAKERLLEELPRELTD